MWYFHHGVISSLYVAQGGWVHMETEPLLGVLLKQRLSWVRKVKRSYSAIEDVCIFFSTNGCMVDLLLRHFSIWSYWCHLGWGWKNNGTFSWHLKLLLKNQFETLPYKHNWGSVSYMVERPNKYVRFIRTFHCFHYWGENGTHDSWLVFLPHFFLSNQGKTWNHRGCQVRSAGPKSRKLP